jgi:hypothetical protein
VTRGRKARRVLLYGFFFSLLSFRPTAAEEPLAPGQEPDAQWLVIGNFKGSRGTGIISRLGSLLFEYERDDSLYRDLGDLGIGIDASISDLQLDWDTYFRRRVVQSHEEKLPGETITASDISYYRNVSAARTRLRATVDYLPDFAGEADAGVEVEGGFAVAMARAQQPTVHTEEPLETVLLDSGGKEFKKFFDENGVSLDKHGAAYVTMGSIGAVVDATAGSLGNQLADTERAAVYWDDYAEPIMLFPKTGLPLKLGVFTSEDSQLAVGDSLTFTTFVGISPLYARYAASGVRIGYKRFFRLLRETTIRKDPDSVVVVRVRNWRGRGNELTPFKFRPSIRVFVVNIGYTFFESVLDRFREKVSDVTFRIDLETEEGARFFETLVKQSGRARISPQLEPIDQGSGVEVLRSELSRGKIHSWRVRASLSSLFRYRKSQLGSTQRIATKDAELREVTRLRSREYRNRIGRDRDVKSASVINVQSDVEWREDLETEGQRQDEKLAVTINTVYSARYANEKEVHALAAGVETLLGLAEPHPVLSELQTLPVEGKTRLWLNLGLSFGPEEIERLAAVTPDQLWTELGGVLLGPEYRDVWSTEGRRYWWHPLAPPYNGVEPRVSHISRHYDALRNYQRPAKKSRVFSPQEYSSRTIFRLASKTVKKFQQLQKVLVEERDCLQCLVSAYSTKADVMLIQALAVRFGGDAEAGGVGYDFEFLVGDMVRPVGDSNGILHGYQLPRGGEIVRNAEIIGDSVPRLRAGQMLLNVDGPNVESDLEHAPCWKLRLYSDHVFDEGLRLRVHWRLARSGSDRSLEVAFFDLPEPRPYSEIAGTQGEEGFVEPRLERSMTGGYGVQRRTRRTPSGQPAAPFQSRLGQARYYYDVPLPWLEGLSEKPGYTVLVRVLNPDGLPVTEEQEVLMHLPGDWQQRVPPFCSSGAATENG